MYRMLRRIHQLKLIILAVGLVSANICCVGGTPGPVISLLSTLMQLQMVQMDVRTSDFVRSGTGASETGRLFPGFVVRLDKCFHLITFIEE